MGAFPGFIGPSNRTTSRSVSVERTIDWYAEQITDGTPKAPWHFNPTPCLTPFTGLYAGPVRALFGQNNRVFAVGGGVFHEVMASQVSVLKGLVAIDGSPATIASNGLAGNQVMVVSGGLGYIYDLAANTFAQITSPDFPANVRSVVFFDGYFIVLTALGEFFLSDLEDGTTWNALDFAAESQFSDTVVAMTATNDNLWLYGTQHIGPWYDSGDPLFPFTPVPGSVMQVGTAAPFSACNLFTTPIWLGQNADGNGIVYAGNGYQPTPVSSFALNQALSTVTASQLFQSVAWTHQDLGHSFYALQVPGLQTTWFWDLTTREWHERAVWNATKETYERHFGQNHTYAFGKHLVGDRQSGVIYSMDSTLNENLLYVVA
jgi:hypothetical protein